MISTKLKFKIEDRIECHQKFRMFITSNLDDSLRTRSEAVRKLCKIDICRTQRKNLIKNIQK